MRSLSTLAYVASALLAFCCAEVGIAFPQAQVAVERTPPVPKASCGPEDHTEGLQGETTLAERYASGPAKAYNCNLELVGQFEGEGASVGLDVFGTCAYFSIMQDPATKHPGVAVLDVSDPEHPRSTAYLDSPGMLGAFESVAVAQTTKLLIGSQLSLTAAPAPFDLYDLSEDCRHPVLRSSASFPGLYSHAGEFSPDGRTYYGSKWQQKPNPEAPPPAAVFALDVGNPFHPRLIATWMPPKDWVTHSAVAGREGTRVYVSVKRMAYDSENSRQPNGLAILDSGEIQARRPNAAFHLVRTLFWDDSRASEGMQPLTIGRRPYLAFSDNLGSLGYKSPPPADACSAGKPSHGFARIIDLSDQKNPRTTSRLMLEAADPSNCSKVMHDPITYGGYGSFGCTVDDEADSRLLACSYFEAAYVSSTSATRCIPARSPTTSLGPGGRRIIRVPSFMLPARDQHRAPLSSTPRTR